VLVTPVDDDLLHHVLNGRGPVTVTVFHLARVVAIARIHVNDALSGIITGSVPLYGVDGDGEGCVAFCCCCFRCCCRFVCIFFFIHHLKELKNLIFFKKKN
jgi:hypothetical protein